MNRTINLFENILVTIWIYNVVIYFISEEIPGFVLPVLSFLTMLVFICVAPYVVHREGYNLIIFSYFCSSSLVFNFYMRSDYEAYLAVYRRSSNQSCAYSGYTAPSRRKPVLPISSTSTPVPPPFSKPFSL
ncbi:uncharacterized protein EV420DRAFT_1635944 [Desarmillaria tabescens]|uniref:Uncharacterized protein n=1 Tax=Armillaria tabescens TaxID=1929756 RepID=A0AA39NJS7_ARMTA|nr:uncharacterized protein EV420DRAFT_1635944 [Desarmillaria tabescens]KAK0466910.1 hypothetical protein EV420DRAFT_1635944 [Desarmillaria tabescens]